MNAPLPQQKSASTEKNTARVIAISSGKGGVGKTNIATNLGITLASRGKRVCIFDADTNLANVNILLNIHPPYTLQQVLNGEKKIEEILVDGPAGLKIIPAASGIAEFIELDRAQQERLLSALKQLESHFDYLLIDTAAGISDSVLNFLQAAPYRILIITPEPTSLTDAFSLVKVLKQRGLSQPFFTIVNMATSAADARAVYRRFKSAVAKYLQQHVRLLGYVLSDAELTRSVIQQQAVVTRAPSAIASRCILNLSSKLEQYLESDECSASFSTFWSGQLTPVSQRENDPQTVQSDSNHATILEGIKCHLQQCNTEEAEALLLQLTQSWVERFGAAPPALLKEISEQCATVATKEALAPTPAELSEDLAGLQQAIHYAQLLDKTEAKLSNPVTAQ